MRHFVAYHSEDRMGYTAEESNPFGLYTSKKLSNPIGDVVWIVAGVGPSPKQYFLSSWFVISEVTAAEHPEFGFTLNGDEGGSFDPMARLDHLSWFPAFWRRMANFSIGLTELRDSETITAFRKVASRAGQPQK
ncbi:MAG: hypothetical protein KF777_16955 [Planctomycetaceae bacterium]|nr:hypothetical protein [Planctomycetaceae bacterium]